MTEKIEQDDYYDKLERLVDTRNISYDDARRLIGEAPEETIPPAEAHVRDALPYHGPFTEQATGLFDRIEQVKYRSHLSRLRPKIARMALRGMSPYEVEALLAALKHRGEQLTYRDPERIEPAS